HAAVYLPASRGPAIGGPGSYAAPRLTPILTLVTGAVTALPVIPQRPREAGSAIMTRMSAGAVRSLRRPGTFRRSNTRATLHLYSWLQQHHAIRNQLVSFVEISLQRVHQIDGRSERDRISRRAAVHQELLESAACLHTEPGGTTRCGGSAAVCASE